VTSTARVQASSCRANEQGEQTAGRAGTNDIIVAASVCDDDVMAKGNAGNAAKAYRLRKREIEGGQTLDPIDKLWLTNYDDEKRDREKQRTKRREHGAKDIGASRARRTVKVDIDEESESAGTGSAAMAAATAALEAREEGRRIDYLSVGAVDALREACSVYKDICISLRERTEVLEATHIAMLESGLEQRAARNEAEIALMTLQQQPAHDDPATALMVQMIARKMGVQLPGFSPTPPTGNGTRERKPPHS